MVGTAAIHIPPEASRSHRGELGFGVAPSFQRRGPGLRLLSAIEQRAAAKGLHRLECSCFAGNVAAMALLRKAGFSQEGRRRQSIRKGTQYLDQLLFGKIIGGAPSCRLDIAP